MAKLTIDSSLREKMLSLANLSNIVSHDLNNFLMAINLNSQLLLKQLAEEDPHREDVLEIVEAGQKATELSRQLQGWIPKKDGGDSTCVVAEALEDVEQDLRRRLGNGISLSIAMPEKTLAIACNEDRLIKALQNLIDNVVDFCPAGLCRIETQVYKTPEGTRAGIAVIDKGPGIEETTLRSIFDPFFTTKPKGKGRGLGLTVVYAIAIERGGEIHIESEPGNGTRIELRFNVAGKAD